jgi:hypothetical protein
VKVVYKLSEKDVREALGKNGGWWTKVAPVVGIFLLAVALGGLVLDPGHSLMAVVPFGIGLLMIFILKLRAQQMFKRGRYDDEIQVEISDSGIDASNSVANAKFIWSAFTRYEESKNLFLLYQSQLMFNIYPKRAFSSEDADAFRSLLVEHLCSASKAYNRKISPKTWVFFAVVGMAFVLAAIAIVRNSR